MEEFDREIQTLFRMYGESISVPEPGPGFMPRLWERIDARRNFAFRMKKLTQLIVATAAAACLLMTGITVISAPSAHAWHATYLDALAEAHPTENLMALGILPHPETPEA